MIGVSYKQWAREKIGSYKLASRCGLTMTGKYILHICSRAAQPAVFLAGVIGITPFR